MARPNTGPRWFESQKAFFVTIKGERHNLGPDRAEANKRFAELMLQAPKLNESMTVAQLVGAYLGAKAPDWKPNTLTLRTAMLRPFAAKYGETPWAKLIPHHLTLYRQEKGWHNGTVRIFLASVQACFRWAKKQGLVSTNPVDDLDKPGRTKRGDHCRITETQRQMLLAASSEAVQNVLEALWHTGNRPGYILTVQAHEVRGDTWECGPMPGRKLPQATIYLNEFMQALTARLLAEHPEGPLFRNHREARWLLRSFCNTFARISDKAGCPDVTPYWYRHTFANRMLDLGMNVHDLARLMNTSVYHVEHTYGHGKTLTDRLRAACRMSTPDSPGGSEAPR